MTIVARKRDSCSSQDPFRHAVLVSQVMACKQQLTHGSKGFRKKKTRYPPCCSIELRLEVLERDSNTADHRTRGHGRQRFSGTQRGRYFYIWLAKFFSTVGSPVRCSLTCGLWSIPLFLNFVAASIFEHVRIVFITPYLLLSHLVPTASWTEVLVTLMCLTLVSLLV